MLGRDLLGGLFLRVRRGVAASKGNINCDGGQPTPTHPHPPDQSPPLLRSPSPWQRSLSYSLIITGHLWIVSPQPAESEFSVFRLLLNPLTHPFHHTLLDCGQVQDLEFFVDQTNFDFAPLCL